MLPEIKPQSTIIMKGLTRTSFYDIIYPNTVIGTVDIRDRGTTLGVEKRRELDMPKMLAGKWRVYREKKDFLSGSDDITFAWEETKLKKNEILSYRERITIRKGSVPMVDFRIGKTTASIRDVSEIENKAYLEKMEVTIQGKDVTEMQEVYDMCLKHLGIIIVTKRPFMANWGDVAQSFRNFLNELFTKKEPIS